MKNFDRLPFNWFDVLLAAVLIIGYYRGRKRGMSVEIFTMFQWVITVALCAFTYEPLGNLLSGAAGLTALTSYIIAYIAVAGVVALVFIGLKNAMSGKTLSADTFGTAEYYLGIPAGIVRCTCILLTAMALLNARYFTTKEVKDRQAYQKDVYGSEFFPGLNALQADVFEASLFGPAIKKNLSFLLIKPTSPMLVHAKGTTKP